MLSRCMYESCEIHSILFVEHIFVTFLIVKGFRKVIHSQSQLSQVQPSQRKESEVYPWMGYPWIAH